MSHGDGVQLLLFCPQLSHLSSDSFLVGCVGFVVSCCVSREHPPTHLGCGHHGVCFTYLAVILGPRPNISKEILWLPFTTPPPLVVVFGPSTSVLDYSGGQDTKEYIF